VLKNLQTVSNFPRSVIEEGGEGIVESGTELSAIDDAVADKLIANGWAKEITATADTGSGT
jgi:hypothetical protein